MAKSKNFTIEFHRVRVAQDSIIKFDDVLQKMAQSGPNGNNGRGPSWYEKDKENAFELRAVNVTEGFISAEFAKIRLDNLPTASSPGGEERDLDLSDDEGLTEKNYLTYWPKDNIVAWQRNMSGSPIARFARYITDHVGEAVSFDNLIYKSAIERLMKDDVKPVSLTIDFAKPTNAAFHDSNNFGTDVVKSLSKSGGDKFSFTVSVSKRSKVKDKAKKFLNTDIKDLAKLFAENENTSKARIDVEDEFGRVHPIDLMTDRILSEQKVKMKGRYPDGGNMYAALRTAFTEKRDAIYDVIGKPDGRIDT